MNACMCAVHKNRHGRCHTPPEEDETPKTLRDVLRVYRRVRGPTVEEEERWWRADGLPFSEVIHRAVTSKLRCGCHHSHQSRIRRRVYAQCETALLAIQGQLTVSQSFDELFGRVKIAFHRIPGAGEMIVYDVADRIALHLGLDPSRVYLHRGTRDGAMALVEGITSRTQYIDVAVLPAPLSKMTPRELETALCVYKGYFRQWS